MSSSSRRRLHHSEPPDPAAPPLPQLLDPTMGRNWADLHDGVLSTILSRLPVADFVRSRAVCRSFRFAAAAAAEFQRVPYLMWYGQTISAACFFSHSEGRTYTIHPPKPDIMARLFLQSTHQGWLVTATGVNMHLLNPFTGIQIELPSLGTLDCLEPLDGSQGAFFNYLIRLESMSPTHFALMRRGFLAAAALSSSPANPDKCFVALLHHPNFLVSFSRLGDHKWTVLIESPHRHFVDVAFHDGLLFLLDKEGGVDAWDLRSPSSKPVFAVAPDPQIMKVGLSGYFILHLVSTPSGELLQIWEDETTFKRVEGIGVYKIDLTERRMLRMGSLGELALFIGGSSTLCLSVVGVPQLKSNHVYVTGSNSGSGMDLYRVYDLDDGSMELVPSTSGIKPLFWVMPSLS